MHHFSTTLEVKRSSFLLILEHLLMTFWPLESQKTDATNYHLHFLKRNFLMNVLSAHLSKSIDIKSRYRQERATHTGCRCAKMRSKQRTFLNCEFTLCALQCLAVQKRFTRCASNFACNVHIDTSWCTRCFRILGPFLDTERDYLLDAL